MLSAIAATSPPQSQERSSKVMAATPLPNMALNLAPFGRWTLRDKAAQRRLALRYALHPAPSHQRRLFANTAEIGIV